MGRRVLTMVKEIGLILIKTVFILQLLRSVSTLRSDDSNPIKKDRGCLGYDRKEDYGIQTFGLFPEFTPSPSGDGERLKRTGPGYNVRLMKRPRAGYDIRLMKRSFTDYNKRLMKKSQFKLI